MTMARVLLSTGSLHVIDVAHCFELAAEAGFDGIEIMCDDRWSTRDPDYLRTLSGRHGLPVLVAHTPFSRRLQGWPGADQLKRIHYTLELAGQVGAEAVVVHLPRKVGVVFIDMDGRHVMLPWRSPFLPVKRWIEGGLPAARNGGPVKIALENMPVNRFLGREWDVTWWNTVEAWSRVHAWLTLDTTHWGTKRIDPLAAYRAARPRVCHVHLSNFDGQEHRLPHRGRLDLGALLREMAADGYSGTVSVELQPEALAFSDAGALRRNLRDSLAFCREHLN
jgi:sugar phosphate isomerase/epimerase